MSDYTNYICKDKKTGKIVRIEYSIWSSKPICPDNVVSYPDSYINYYGFRVFDKEDKNMIEKFEATPDCNIFDKYEVINNSDYKLYYIYREFKGCVLSTNEGEFFGEGNFCGYYSKSGFKNCHLIADYDGHNTIYKEVTRTVDDMYTCPKIIIAKNDKEAIKYFDKHKNNIFN